MNRRNFLGIAGASFVVAGSAAYLLSDRRNFVRTDLKESNHQAIPLKPGEREILYLASLAPSGHNTQPWVVKYVEPFHWIIANDRTKWLPAVDPTQRETILSIGAFIQNLEYAAAGFGYSCAFKMLALSNQDEDIVEVKLTKSSATSVYDVKKIERRRTVRSGYLNNPIKEDHITLLTSGEKDYFHFFPNHSREFQWLNEQTIEANREQAYRDDAQAELADWMRLSSKEASTFCDGLTTAGMEIQGIAGWVVRNFYTRENIMSSKFREQGIDKVRAQVSRSGGWLLITSKDSATSTLLETGKRLQRMLLNIREKNIAIHPMTQILEEDTFRAALNASIGISDPVHFILRTGYLKDYPDPVSLRRPVDRFVRGI